MALWLWEGTGCTTRLCAGCWDEQMERNVLSASSLQVATLFSCFYDEIGQCLHIRICFLWTKLEWTEPLIIVSVFAVGSDVLVSIRLNLYISWISLHISSHNDRFQAHDLVNYDHSMDDSLISQVQRTQSLTAYMVPTICSPAQHTSSSATITQWMPLAFASAMAEHRMYCTNIYLQSFTLKYSNSLALVCLFRRCTSKSLIRAQVRYRS